VADSTEPRKHRYSAFISYSHADIRFARRLHRRLEAYRLPRQIAQDTHAGRDAGRHLKPVFRDADELTAAPDLTTAVRQAIAEADYLIVVCSPAAAASVWVGREVELFRGLNGDDQILTALVEGTAETAFHPALRGDAARPALHPLAADFRPSSAEREAAFLKLVAPLAGVGLDALVRRDAQRRIRQLGMIAGGAVAATAIMALLTVVAINGRAAAERERAKSESLVDFMLTDLRKKLKPVGRLDLLSTVNSGATRDYRNEDISHLPDTALQQRAKLLQAMGEDNEKRGQLNLARTEFDEARRTTAALLAAQPSDPKRIFAQGQSEYWVGFINWRLGDGARARAGFEAYSALAQDLLQMDPTNPDWRMEAGYAQSNLGMLVMRQAGDPAGAEQHFTRALEEFRKVAATRPTDRDTQGEIADGLGWLADSQRLQGDFDGALASRAAERKILKTLLAQDPRDAEVRVSLLGNELALARIAARRGRFAEALDLLDRGHAAAAALARSDPENGDISKEMRAFELFEIRTRLDMPSGARASPQALATRLGGCGGKIAADQEILDFCRLLRARLQAAAGDLAGARKTLESLSSMAKSSIYSSRWGINFAEESRLVLDSKKHERN